LQIDRTHEASPPGNRRSAAKPHGMKEDRAVEWCDCLIDIAAALFSVSGRELRRPGRSTLDVARVRQIAMYVGHVVLRLSMSDVGRGFGRDRTTVLYACHLVEDMRDDTDFDRIVATMERLVGAVFRERGTI
jgi:chromosomal replication initiation ATPase DnaA